MKNQSLLPVLVILCFAVAIPAGNVFSQTNKIKNVIIMIPDGTSTSVLSMARWYQLYKDHNGSKLAVDSIICGLVKTFCSDAPIGDSAPTSSCYSTGQESLTGFIATYPLSTANDLVKTDPAKAYQPMMTVLEAAKLSGKSTGLVFTCEFPHATPADFSAHYYKRSDYSLLAKQIVYNNIDIVFGGGDTILKKTEKNWLGSNGYDTISSDYKRFKNITSSKAWALMEHKDMKYDIDRDTTASPSLTEMTEKAISLLSRNKDNGFFLMVEGSKVDWAAHSNDPVGVITEFLAFDKAVKAALKFAKADGNTVVIVCPDHGNSGISMGNRTSNNNYDGLSLVQLMEPLANCKLTAEGMAAKLLPGLKGISDPANKTAIIFDLFSKYCSIDSLSNAEIQSLVDGAGNKSSYLLTNAVATIFTSRTYIGFTTTGHTGEDVFLGIFSPSGVSHPTGLVTGKEINIYLCKTLNIASLQDSTEKYFCAHKTVFKGCKDTIININGEITLKVTKGSNVLEVPAYKNVAYFNNKAIKLNTVTVYVDKNKTFYLPKALGLLMN